MTNKTAHEIVREAIEFSFPLCGGLSIANDKAQSLLYEALAILETHAVVPREMTDDLAEKIASMANCCGGIAESIHRIVITAATEGE